MRLMLAALLIQSPSKNSPAERIASLPPVTIHTGTAGVVTIVLTGFLVAVGIGGVIVAIITLRRIKQQAEAAKASADAFITGNRPWLLLSQNTIPEGSHSAYAFQYRVRNFGKTPAKVIAFHVEFHIANEKNPPNPESLANDTTFNPYILAQGDQLSRLTNLRTDSRFAEIEQGAKIWLFGVIRYQDTFERPDPVTHETLFCLRYAGDNAWVRGGPPEYNRAT